MTVSSSGLGGRTTGSPDRAPAGLRHRRRAHGWHLPVARERMSAVFSVSHGEAARPLHRGGRAEIVELARASVTAPSVMSSASIRRCRSSPAAARRPGWRMFTASTIRSGPFRRGSRMSAWSRTWPPTTSIWSAGCRTRRSPRSPRRPSISAAANTRISCWLPGRSPPAPRSTSSSTGSPRRRCAAPGCWASAGCWRPTR